MTGRGHIRQSISLPTIYSTNIIFDVTQYMPQLRTCRDCGNGGST